MSGSVLKDKYLKIPYPPSALLIYKNLCELMYHLMGIIWVKVTDIEMDINSLITFGTKRV